MSVVDYLIIEVEAVPEENIYCSRCNKQFTRNPNVKKGTAQYYRCNECLSLKTTAKDLLYSCNIM